MNHSMTSSPPRRRQRWIGFFVVLSVLAAIAIVVPIVYNLSIQLRPEQLAEARRLWRENGPADYDLAYLVQTSGADGEEQTQYQVKVRGGRTVYVEVNGEMVAAERTAKVAERYGVPELFDEIEAGLQRDAASGRRNFATAQFDPKDGHPFHYVHRVAGTKERVEWNVKMTRLAR
jgi:hypothetical protein